MGEEEVKQSLYHTNLRNIGVYITLFIGITTLSSHKIGGPKGAGALVVKNKRILKSFLIGGSQEYNLRAGTESVTAIAGFGMAANSIDLNKMKNIKKVRDFFEKELINENNDIWSLSVEEDYHEEVSTGRAAPIIPKNEN